MFCTSWMYVHVLSDSQHRNDYMYMSCPERVAFLVVTGFHSKVKHLMYICIEQKLHFRTTNPPSKNSLQHEISRLVSSGAILSFVLVRIRHCLRPDLLFSFLFGSLLLIQLLVAGRKRSTEIFPADNVWC